MEVVCACCGRIFIRSPRNKNQTYCSNPECQRKRKTLWQKNKMASDASYRLNHKTSQQEWIRNNSGYWKNYRKKNPDKAKRNRELQMIRNRRKRNPSLIAKMDALIVSMFSDNQGSAMIAKKDSISSAVSLS